MITIAREVRGMTQMQLSASIPKLSQGNLSKMEKGIIGVTEEVIQKRLRRAETKIARSADYDEHVVNDVVDTCAEEIYSIIQKRIAEPDAE